MPSKKAEEDEGPSPADVLALQTEVTLLEAEVVLLAELESAELELELARRRDDVAAGLVPEGMTRALYPHERRSKVNFAAMASRTDQAAEELSRLLLESRREAAKVILDDLRQAAAGLGELEANRAIVQRLETFIDPAQGLPPELKRAFGDALKPLYEVAEPRLHELALEARDAVYREAIEQGVPTPGVPSIPEGLKDLEGRAGAAGFRAQAKVVDALYAKAHQLPVYGNLTPNAFLFLLETTATNLSARELDSEAKRLVHRAEGIGREHGAATTPRIREIYASELLDSRTCGPCQMVDGKLYETMAEARVDYPTSGYVGCLGGDLCRGTLVFVWDTEAPPTLQVPGDRPTPPGGEPGPIDPPDLPPSAGPTPPAGAPKSPPKRVIPEVDVTHTFDPSKPGAIRPKRVSELLGRDLDVGETIRLTRGHVHGRHLQGATARVLPGNRLAVVEDGLDFTTPKWVERGISSTDEVLDELESWVATIPDDFADAVETIAVSRNFSPSHGPTAVASSDGPTIVFWKPDNFSKVLGRSTFDHELGHSIRHVINRRIAKLYNEADPSDYELREALEKLRSYYSEPGDAWKAAMRADNVGTKVSRAQARLRNNLAEAESRYRNLYNDPDLVVREDASLKTAGDFIRELIKTDGNLELETGILDPITGKPWTVSDLLGGKKLTKKQLEDIGLLKPRVDLEEVAKTVGDHRLAPTGRDVWTGSQARSGVSSYGASEPSEDWAETIRLWLRDRREGKVARSKLTGADVTFSELFPERARLLEQIADLLGFEWWS